MDVVLVGDDDANADLDGTIGNAAGVSSVVLNHDEFVGDSSLDNDELSTDLVGDDIINLDDADGGLCCNSCALLDDMVVVLVGDDDANADPDDTTGNAAGLV